MGTVYSGTNARYLQPGLAIKIAYEVMQKNLYWLDILPKMRTDTGSFIYNYRSFNISNDAKKETAPMKVEGAKFARLDMSRPVTAGALTESVGFEMAIDRKGIQNPDSGVATITRTMEYLGYVLTEQANTSALSTMQSGATTSFTKFSPPAVWSNTSAAQPVQDLKDLASDMTQEGYPQRLTDAFVNKTNWDELNDYLLNVDIGDVKQREMFGTPAMGYDDAIVIPAAGGVRVHNTFSNITEGAIMGIDSRPGLVGAELHYYIDPEFATVQTSYQAIENGRTVTKSTNNPGIHFHTYMEDDTHDVILQMWQDKKVVVTQDDGIFYSSSGI